jgi:glycosyltransferase involved in cell wall biosynthesis
LKIALVKNGGISIPPQGWGAIELVTWEYKKGLEKLGHQVDIIWLDEVREDYDIIHVHSCNLALLAKERGLRYVFSFHDHHPISNGRDGIQFYDQKRAFEGSLFSLCPAEWIVDYFGSDKLFFLSHGVDTSFFTDEGKKPITPKLLCIASNGANGDHTIDRKGFRYAVESARTLGLEITVAGPPNNRVFFEAYPELEYSKLTKITDNPNKKSVRELYNSHSIFLHPSFIETGHPNLTILEAISCGTPVVGTYDGLQKIESLYRIEKPSTNLVIQGIVEVLKNYKRYCSKTKEDALRFDWSVSIKRLNDMYVKFASNT